MAADHPPHLAPAVAYAPVRAWLRRRHVRLTPFASREDLFAAGIVGAVAFVFVLALVRLLTAGAGDLGLVGVLSTDEELAGRTVRHMLATHGLSPNHFFSYGALTSDLAFLLLLPWEWTTGVSDTAIIVTLRAISLAGGVAAVALTAALAWRIGGRVAAVGAAVAMAVTPELVQWSSAAHPDTPQLALLTATLVVTGRLAERHTWRRLLLCGLLAGLTFGTKYAGLLCLPLVIAAALVGRVRAGSRPTPRRTLGDLALIVTVFSTTFMLTNPYALVEPTRFAGQLRAELVHAQVGHVFDEGDGGLAWLRTLATPGLGGPVITVLAAAGVLVVMQRWRGATARHAAALGGEDGAPAFESAARGERAGGPARAGPSWDALVLLMWFGGYLAYLVLRVGYGAPRYALPLLPAIAVFAGVAVAACAARVRAFDRRVATAGVVIVLLLAVAGPAHEALARTREQWSRAAELDRDPRVIAGRWLDAEAPPGAIVLRDAYVYLPPRRASAPVTFGLTVAQLARLRPDYVVVNEDIRGRFRWEVGADRYVDGPDAYHERMQAYAGLEANGLGCYGLVRDFGPVQVYERTAETTACEFGP